MHHAHIDMLERRIHAMLTYYAMCDALRLRGTGWESRIRTREPVSPRVTTQAHAPSSKVRPVRDPNLCMQTIWRPAIARPHRDVSVHKLLRKAHDRIDEHSLSHGARSPCWRALTCAQRRRNKDEAGRGLVSAGVNHHDFARPKGACPLKRDRRANRAELPPAVAFTRSLPRGMAGRRERW